MKFLPIYFLILIAHLGLVAIEKSQYEIGAQASKPIADWSIEIMNKMAVPISVAVDGTSIKNAPYFSSGINVNSADKDKRPAFARFRDIDTKKPIAIIITTQPKTGKPLSWGYAFKGLGKTIYLTVDANGARPQSGPLLGFKGITESGLTKNNNVVAKDVDDAKKAYPEYEQKKRKSTGEWNDLLGIKKK